MIIHIATDEKFIDSAYKIYEKAFPGKNKFIILYESSNKIRYINRNNPYILVDIESDVIKATATYVSKAKICVFHGMNEFQAKIALAWRYSAVSKVWSPYGSEVNNNPLIVKNRSIGPLTHSAYVRGFKRSLKNLLRTFYYRLKSEKSNRFFMIKEALLSMDFAAMLDYEEFNNFKRLKVAGPSLKFVKFTYYPLWENSIKTPFNLSNNILIGNSAFPTNNHLEAFDKLKGMELSKFTLIAPLSYGDVRYADLISQTGKRFFGKNFVTLKDFLPLDEYENILRSCGIVISNSYRTQGAGNILTALLNGSKVFLSSRNTFYHYLTRLGCQVYSIENDLISDNAEALTILSEMEMENNRTIVSNELSVDGIVDSIRGNWNTLLE